VAGIDLGNNCDGSIYRCPLEKPLCVWGVHVYTAMAHGVAEVAVPIGTVKAIAFVKIHRPGNVGQVVIVNAFDATAHVVELVFFVNFVFTCDRRVVRCTGRDDEFFEKNTVFKGINTLSGQDDDNLFAF